jgi:hypothetical protein
MPKKITDYTDDELNAAVEDATDEFPEFYTLLRGIDSYMERRRRKLGAETALRLTEAVAELQEVVLKQSKRIDRIYSLSGYPE